MELEADPSCAQPRRVCFEAAAHRGRVCTGRIRAVSGTQWVDSDQMPRATGHVLPTVPSSIGKGWPSASAGAGDDEGEVSE